MTTIQLLEDTQCVGLHPFHHLDGIGGIRFGAFTQQERWDAVEAKLTAANGPAKTIQVNGRWVPGDDASELLSPLLPGDALMHEGICIAICGDEGALEPRQLVHAENSPFLISHANQLFSALGEQLIKDVAHVVHLWSLSANPTIPNTLVFGSANNLWVADSALIRAATIDTEQGPVVIGPNVIIEPGAHLSGPLVICAGATVRMGARISGPSVVGPQCKVGGELSNVNFQGWANKAHDGFLGNSAIGRWCNLGAGTESSNLKNTYGEVKQWNQGSGTMESTGLQFCGLLMGDHSKCGIGTMFNTGTVVDPACVIYDAGFVPKHLPPFSWYNARNEDMQIQSLDRMLNTAAKVMARRGVTMTKTQCDNLTRLHQERVQSGS